MLNLKFPIAYSHVNFTDLVAWSGNFRPSQTMEIFGLHHLCSTKALDPGEKERHVKQCAMCSIYYIRLRHDYDYANWCGQVFWISSHPFQYRFLWFNQTNKKGPTQNAQRSLNFLAKKSGHKRRFFGRTVDQSRQLSSQPSSATKSGIKACKLYFQSKTQANNPNWTHSRPTYYFYLLGFLLPAPSIT